MLIDSHCHLYLEEFESDLPEVIQRALDMGIHRFYLPAIDSHTTAAMMKLEEAYPGVCICMAGLHPCSVKANYMDEIALVKDWLMKRKFAAIGEIGLDFYWDKTFIKEQYEAFNQQVELAISYHLPIVIHTRNAMEQTIDVIKNFEGKVRGIFHCFGGNLREANEIIKLGFLLGIGGVATYKNTGLSEVLKEVDLKHLVLETDSPFLTPVPFRGKRNESSYLKFIVEKIAFVKGVDPEEVAAVTSANASGVFAY